MTSQLPRPFAKGSVSVNRVLMDVNVHILYLSFSYQSVISLVKTLFLVAYMYKGSVQVPDVSSLLKCLQKSWINEQEMWASNIRNLGAKPARSSAKQQRLHCNLSCGPVICFDIPELTNCSGEKNK